MQEVDKLQAVHKNELSTALDKVKTRSAREKH